MKKESNRSKIRGILVSLLIVVILLLVIIALFIYFYGSGITGNVIYNGGNYSGTGFAPPYDTANPSTLLFSVNHELASSSNGNVSISVSAARDSGVIFKTGYYFDNSTSNWIAFNFSSTVKSSSFLKDFTILANFTYKSPDSAVGAEIINGVRASSIKIESTSSTIAKLCSR